MSLKDVKSKKGLGEKEQLLDRAGLLELSAHDFQMNLAANVISQTLNNNEQKAIKTNFAVAKKVRQTIIESGAKTPEHLALEPPIKDVKKSVGVGQKQKTIEASDPND